MGRRISMSVVILIVLMSIGFAAVTTSLIASSSASLASNSTDFQVYFSYANSEQGGTATISRDGKSIIYNSKKLTEVGETTSLMFVVTNESSLYDADVNVTYNINNVVDGVDYSSYFTITRSTFRKHEVISAQSHTEGIITIRLDKNVSNDVSLAFTINLDVSAKERTEPGSNLPNIVYGNELEMTLYSMINDYRINHGLNPLYWDGDLYTAAQVRSVEIEESFSNTRPNGEPFYTANYDKIYGELLSYQYIELIDAINAWLAEPTTYANVMSGAEGTNTDDPFTAFACAINDNTYRYIACEFGFRYDL